MLAMDANGQKVRIILIDDNETMCRLLARYFMLEDDLDIIGTANNGMDGIGLVDQLKPDLVLTDFNLPDISGQTVTALICRSNPDVQVVVMSAEQEQWMVEQVQQAGAAEFILKSGNPDHIVQAVRRSVKQ